MLLDRRIIKVAEKHPLDFSLTLHMKDGTSCNGNVIGYDKTTKLITIHNASGYSFIYLNEVTCFGDIHDDFYRAIMAKETLVSALEPDEGDEDSAYA